MVKTLLLFDVDGTLLKTGGAGMRAMEQVGRALFGRDFSFEGIQVSGHLDPLIFAEAAANNGVGNTPFCHQSFRDGYLKQLELELTACPEKVHPTPGVERTLGLLRDRVAEHQDVVLGLLTGNYTLAVPIKLAAAGLDPGWFKVTAFGDEAPSRSALVPVAIKKYKAICQEPIDANRIIVIGDTPRDVACAHDHGCVAFGVATGSFGVDQLRGVGADVVVKDLSDPTPLIRLVDAAAP